MDEFKIIPPTETRFGTARADGAERAALLLAAGMLEGVGRRVLRAHGLLLAVIVESALGRAENKREASKALASAIDDLKEIVSELGE